MATLRLGEPPQIQGNGHTSCVSGGAGPASIHFGGDTSHRSRGSHSLSGTQGPQYLLKPGWLRTHRAVSLREILFTKARCCVFFKNAVAVLSFNSFGILIKDEWNNQPAKLEGNSKAGQSKPPTWVRKPRFRGEASQSLLTPPGSRCFLLVTRHMCPMPSPPAKPLAGLPSGKCWAAPFPGAQPHGQCGPRASSWLSTLSLSWPPEHRPQETCSRPQGH